MNHWWRIEQLGPLDTEATARYHDGLRSLASGTAIRVVGRFRHATTRQYVAIEGCPQCRHGRCEVGCQGARLRQVVASVGPALRATPLSKGLRADRFATVARLTPLSVTAAPLPLPIGPNGRLDLVIRGERAAAMLWAEASREEIQAWATEHQWAVRGWWPGSGTTPVSPQPAPWWGWLGTPWEGAIGGLKAELPASIVEEAAILEAVETPVPAPSIDQAHPHVQIAKELIVARTAPAMRPKLPPAAVVFAEEPPLPPSPWPTIPADPRGGKETPASVVERVVRSLFADIPEPDSRWPRYKAREISPPRMAEALGDLYNHHAWPLILWLAYAGLVAPPQDSAAPWKLPRLITAEEPMEVCDALKRTELPSFEDAADARSRYQRYRLRGGKKPEETAAATETATETATEMEIKP